MNGPTVFAGTGFEMDPIIDGFVHRTTDLGETWDQVGGEWGGFVLGFCFHGGAVFALTEVGVYRSTNGGTVWVPCNNGLTGGWFSRSAASNEALLVAGHGGLFRTTNRGFSWREITFTGSTEILDLDARGSTVFAATDEGICRSLDAGIHWNRMTAGLPSAAASSVALNGTMILGVVGGSLYRSSNNGTSWTAVPGGLPAPETRDLLAVRGVLFSLCDAGVFRSTDTGGTWVSVNEGIPAGSVFGLTHNATHLFVASPTATYRRPLAELDVPSNIVANSGFEEDPSPWAFYTDGAGGFTQLAVPGASGTRAARVFIAAPGSNVQLYQAGLALDPNTGYRVRFRAYSSRGHDLSLYVARHTPPYTNYGLAAKVFSLGPGWQSFSATFVTAGFTEPVVDARLRFWFAPFDATGDRFYVDDVLLEAVSPHRVESRAGSTAAGLSLEPFPNPFNPSTELRFQVVEASRVSLGVYDLLGRSVAELVNQDYEPGFHAVSWNAADVASGVYFVRLAVTGRARGTTSVSTAKVLFMK